MGSNGGYIGYDATPKGDGKNTGIWGMRDVYLAQLRGMWTPLVPANALRHYDASQITGLGNADPVSQWNDLSANADHAVQATSTKQPTYRTGVFNGEPVVRFDGTDDGLYLAELFDTASAVGHIFVVAKASATGARPILTTRPVSANEGWALRYNSATKIQYYHTSVSPVPEYTVTDQPNIIELRRDGLSITIGANGALAAAASLPSYLSSGLGKTNIGERTNTIESYFSGDIAQIVIYDRLLTTVERTGLLTYLSLKYAIALA